MLYTKIVFFCMVSYFCYANNSALFENNPTKDGHTCSTSGVVFTETYPSLSRCALKCQADKNCQRFYYQPVSQVCIGCTSDMDQTSGFYGSKCYERKTAYLGCYQDYQHNRVLIQGFTTSDVMTNQLCFQHCVVTLGLRYAGTQQPGLCFCGNNYNRSDLLPDSNCDHVCLGDSEQFCGGGYKNSIYSTPFTFNVINQQ